MVARAGKTSAIVLPEEQWDALKKVALIRALTGRAVRGSVSEVLRDMVAEQMPALIAEIENHERGTRP